MHSLHRRTGLSPAGGLWFPHREAAGSRPGIDRYERHEPLQVEETMSSKFETRVLMARVMAARGVVESTPRERATRPAADLPNLLQRIAHASGGIVLPFRNLKELHR